MPLCCSKVEHVATEDLVELSEIEKYNLGQVMLKIVKFVGILFLLSSWLVQDYVLMHNLGHVLMLCLKCTKST